MRRRISLKAKRTPDQWCHHFGTVVLDPDGWRGAMLKDWGDKMTQDEFMHRWSYSTAKQGPKVRMAMFAYYERKRRAKKRLTRKAIR